MKKIKLLPQNLINQIAAGEVIERPSAVVKELVENSVDAGATRIEIEVSNEARDIRVADNGSGIDKDDVELAFSRHATSKIQSQSDLSSIQTLGFRGEALASVISVAKVSCKTKTKDAETGISVICENSEISISETGCAVGTTIEVRDLFYNIPARLKFLKQPQTELAGITEIVQNIAVSHPHIAFNLINKKHSIVKTTGNSDIAVAISEIYSRELIKELEEVNFTDKQFNLSIKGYASRPDFTRSNKKGIFVFVNSRTVKCPIISKAIDTAYKDLIPSGKYPFAVLDIRLPAQDIDVNVHPSKKEIKYVKPNLIFNFVYSGIKKALEGSPLKLVQDTANDFSGYSGINDRPLKEPDRGGNADLWLRLTEPSASFQENDEDQKVVSFSKFADMKDDEIIELPYPVNKIEREKPVQNKFIFNDENNPEQNGFEKPKIIGQLNNTYILIESGSGLQLIDQHIAQERYIYERLKENKSNISQLLLTSFFAEIDYEQAALLEENMELLAKYGFELEFNLSGDKTSKIKLKKVPQLLADKNPEKIINDLIEAVKSDTAIIENEILEKIACSASVKAGEKLSEWQMEELIINWMRTKNNRTCPHGRKICHTIPVREIAKFFGRTE